MVVVVVLVVAIVVAVVLVVAVVVVVVVVVYYYYYYCYYYYYYYYWGSRSKSSRQLRAWSNFFRHLRILSRVPVMDASQCTYEVYPSCLVIRLGADHRAQSLDVTTRVRSFEARAAIGQRYDRCMVFQYMF